jgi:hypothetical protein
MSESVLSVNRHIGTKKKKCFKCEKLKAVTEFYKHPQMADGRLNKCKECTKGDVQKNYRKNISHFKQYDKGRVNYPHRVKAREDYSKTDRGRAAGGRAKRAWIGRNQEKRKAQIALGNAIRDGKIDKGPCIKCASIHNVHGHHEDYNYPLDVVWLCPKCHKIRHNEIDNI